MIAQASAPAPRGRKAPVARDETLDHRNGDLLGWQGLGKTGRLRMHLGIGHQHVGHRKDRLGVAGAVRPCPVQIVEQRKLSLDEIFLARVSSAPTTAIGQPLK